jgi:hypothetical protein
VHVPRRQKADLSEAGSRIALSCDHGMAERVIPEVIAVEPLPIGARGPHRAVVRWSDGSVGEALRWWDD